MNIRSQLAVLFAVIVASLLLVFSLVVYYASATFRQQEFYARLTEKSRTMGSLLFGKGDNIDPGLLRLFDARNLTALYQEEVTVYDEQNRIVYDSGTDHFTVSPEVFAHIRQNKEAFLSEGEKEVSGVTFAHGPRSYVIITSGVDRYGRDKLEYLLGVLLAGWVAGVGVVILAGWLFAGRALEPITNVVRQVDNITASRLNARVRVENNKDEIGQLATIFNRMLERLEAAFAVQKSFVSNASHEIRTPLTALTGQLEVTLMQPRSPDEYRATLASVLEDVRGMTDLANGLLTLAQASGDTATVPLASARVDELLWQARAELLRKKPGCQVLIEFDELPDDEEAFTLAANEALLKTAFLNLMENGCKFSADHRVRVSLHAASRVVIRFTDAGVGIPEADLQNIFQPFFRSSTAGRVPGHGVGLSLTEKIVKLHGGLLWVTSRVGEGSVFTVSLPPLPTPPKPLLTKEDEDH